MGKYIEDIFITLGALLIAGATFMLSTIAGLYVTGAILVASGLFCAKYAGKRGGK